MQPEREVMIEALEREARLLRVKERLILERLKRLEEEHGMSTGEAVEAFEEGRLGDDELYFYWWGLARALKAVRERLEAVERLLRELQGVRGGG